jgi:hypothetical protein
MKLCNLISGGGGDQTFTSGSIVAVELLNTTVFMKDPILLKCCLSLMPVSCIGIFLLRMDLGEIELTFCKTGPIDKHNYGKFSVLNACCA